MDERLFIAISKFKEGQKEHERGTAIYKFAFEYMSKDKAAERKFQYEQEIKENASSYDAGFDYLRLMESEGIFFLLWNFN